MCCEAGGHAFEHSFAIGCGGEGWEAGYTRSGVRAHALDQEEQVGVNIVVRGSKAASDQLGAA